MARASRFLRLGLGSLVIALASPAWAIDLTGVWGATRAFACTDVQAAGVVKEARTIPDLLISQSGTVLTADASLFGSSFPMRGRVIDDPKGTGRGLLHACDVSPDVASYEIVAAETFPEDDEGVSGRLLVRFLYANGSALRTCKKVEFRRITATNPAPSPCP